jgi:superfamily I DNA/RNA helicase
MEKGMDIENKYKDAKAKRKLHVERILNSASKKKIVVAGPGTGKTHLFKNVLEKKKNSLTLTFVNSLVDDLSLELCGLSEVRTLHSFARHMLHHITNKDVKIFPKLAKVIAEDAMVLMKKEIDFENIFHDRDDENEYIAFYRKRKTYYDNFYGYSDIIFSVVKYLEAHREKIPSYDQILVDEFQDFNKLEVSLIDILSEKSPILLTGDDDQALYPFKSASPEHMRQRHSDKNPDYEPFALPFCSRCTEVIVNTANDVISAATKNGHLADRVSKPYEYFADHDKDAESEKNPKILYCQRYARQIPWFIEDQIHKIAEDVKSKFSVLIISATNSQSRLIAETLKAKGFENVVYVDKRAEKGLRLLDGLKLLLENNKSNLGWRILCQFLLKRTDFEAILEQTDKEGTKSIYEMVNDDCKSQVKEMLQILSTAKNNKPIDEKSLPVLKKMGLDPCEIVKEVLKEEIDSDSKGFGNPGIRKIPVRATTIQSSKGLAEDYVFITYFDDQYFIRSREKKISDLDICNFIVALTRARKKVFLISSQEKEPIFLKWIDQERIERL